MKRLTITLDIQDDTTWEKVIKAISYNTPANTSLVVREGTQYEIRTHGVKGSAVTVDTEED